MATLIITEHYHGGIAGMQVVKWPRIAKQNVTIAGASAQSAAFSPETRLIRVNCDVACCIAIGASPTADVTEARLAPNQTEYLEVKPGDKIAVIAST